jgi:hypothetical protein
MPSELSYLERSVKMMATMAGENTLHTMFALAILMDAQPTFEGNFEGHHDDVEHWLYVHGIRPYDGLEGEWGSKESHVLYQARFPTTIMLKCLAGNGRSSNDALQNVIARWADEVAAYATWSIPRRSRIRSAQREHLTSAKSRLNGFLLFRRIICYDTRRCLASTDPRG